MKPCSATRRVEIPPGNAWPAAGSESWVVEGRPSLPSVDSECAGRVMEPRKDLIVGVDTVDGVEDSTDTLWDDRQGVQAERGGPTGA